MVRRTNNPKKKCGYKRCKWPRLKYKKYCEQHVDMFLEGTPLMRTFSQIVGEHKNTVLHSAPVPLIKPASPPTKQEKKLSERIRGFIFKQYGSND